MNASRDEGLTYERGELLVDDDVTTSQISRFNINEIESLDILVII